MAFTQQDLDTLDGMIAQGVLRVEDNGKRVEYRSMAELLQARNLVAQALGKTGAKGTRRVAHFSRGLD